MARIPQDELERIKQDISLLRLVESQGYEITRQGKDYVMACPFHDDDTPSLIVSPKSNLFHCFGCEAAGSVIDWVMKTQGVSFRHAVELLKNNASPLVANALVKKTTVPKLETPVTADVDDQALLQQVMDYYHQTLKETSEAKAYLRKRGLDDAELINYFRLGYANRTLGLRLPQRNRKAGKDLREQLQRIGLYRDTGREHFNGSLVVPVMDGQGVISEVYGRKLLDSLRKGTPKHTYLPGAHAGVFNAAGLAGVDEIILCESFIDALTFWRWGFTHVTSSYGANGFTDELLQAFIDNQVKRVLIAYDRDEAGDRAAIKLAKQLNKNNIDAYRILFPKGMDANEYALQVTPAQKSLGLVIRKAEPMGEVVHAVQTSFAAKEKATEIDIQATPAPQLVPTIPIEITANEIYLTLGERIYRIKGFDAKAISDTLKINLMVMCKDGRYAGAPGGSAPVKQGDCFHLDKLDLYSSKQRQVFINQASAECGVEPDVIKTDLGKVLLQLETLQQAEPEDPVSDTKTLSDKEKTAALSLLKDRDLLSRILSDFNQAGVVGEETNKLVGYLACVSRKLDKPLAVIIQSSSAAGKSALMESILTLMPEEQRVQYSAMTGQSLFYMGETHLKHKILAISEEEGAHNASYALKLLQSEGEVTIASTGKDEATGDLVTKEYKVEGPVMLFLTTTAIDIDEELLNRCLVLSVNESREQTQAIHAAQRARRTLQGLKNKLEKERITQLHHNAQRLLKPLAVINPYADQLSFRDDLTRTRRDHEKYLTLIDSIALLHQYQRDIKTIAHDGQTIEYVEVTLADIETANHLAREVLGKTLDELPPQTRKLLTLITDLVNRECKAQGIDPSHYRFSRRQIRQHCGWSETQVRVHMQRLMSMEYLLSHRGGRGQSFEYELLYGGEGEAGESFLMGLLDIESVKQLDKNSVTTATSRDELTDLAGSSRPQRGVVAVVEKPLQPCAGGGLEPRARVDTENVYPPENTPESYRHPHRTQSTPCASAVGSKANVPALAAVVDV